MEAAATTNIVASFQSEPGSLRRFFTKSKVRTVPLDTNSNGHESIPRPPWTFREPSTLCETCASINLTKLLLSKRSEAVFYFGQRFNHHNSYHDLILSAKRGCELCRLIWTYDRTDHLVNAYMKGEDRGIDYGLQDPKIQCYVIRGGPTGDGDYLHFEQTTHERYRGLKVEFGFFTYDEDPASTWINGRPLGNNVWSDGRFHLANSWLQDCIENHGGCKKPSGPSSFKSPTRLIDVGDENLDPKLVIGGDKGGKWIALSHRWGESTNVMTTTKETIDDNMRGIGLSKLSPTFQHAIVLTRLLGYKYLWIDSLCIIQKSATDLLRLDPKANEQHDKDWNTESIKMAEYYGRAAMTLFADISADGMIFEGTREASMELVKLPFTSPDGSQNGNVYLRPSLLEEHVGRCTTERGWVLQEEFLFRRGLHFGLQQMFWHCREARHAEGYRRLQNLSSPGMVPTPLIPAPSGLVSAENIRYFKKEMDLWYSLVNNYVCRNLSEESDRVPAISSLALDLQSRNKYTYGAGLWRQDLARGLMWTMKGCGCRIEDPTPANFAPSWSWASLKYEKPDQAWNKLHLIYEDQEITTRGHELISGISEEDIIEFTIAPCEGKTIFDSVSSIGTSLTICSSWLAYKKLEDLKYTKPLWSTQNSWQESRRHRERNKEEEWIECLPDQTLPADRLNKYCPIDNTIFFEVAKYKSDDGFEMVHALLLVEAVERPGKFQKVGIALIRWGQKISNASWKRENITLI